MLTLVGIASLSWLMTLCVRLSAAVQEGDVRLVGGEWSSEGRVEVYFMGQWGTVCDSGWDMADAQVVCRQLRLPGAQSVVRGGTYRPGSGAIWLGDLDCNGTEHSLSSCPSKGWGFINCTHAEDAGVICEKTVASKFDRMFHLDHTLGLSGELGALFDSKRDCDLGVVVHSPEPEVGVDTYCIHRLVLSLSIEPPRYNQALQSGNLTMNVSQDCRSYVSQFLRYMYTRTIDISVSSAQCVHQLASDFKMKRLQEGAGQLFSHLLPWDNTFHTQASLYRYAVQSGDLSIQEICLQFLAWNCKALASSPAWPTLSRDTLEALLSRSDLAVPDEVFVLRALESWARDGRSSAGVGDEAALLRLVRFPMIPPTELHTLPFTSDLYGRHGQLFRLGMLRSFEFHALPLAQIKAHLNRSDEHLPRIYTGTPWSLDVKSTSASSGSRRQRVRHEYAGYIDRFETVKFSIDHTFSTPVHTSAVLKDKDVTWIANVFKTQEECSTAAVQCDTVPAVRLRNKTSLSDYQSSIRFTNRVLLACGGRGGYVFHVRDFKDQLALIPASNGTGQAYPCYERSNIYRFVVRPEYI